MKTLLPALAVLFLAPPAHPPAPKPQGHALLAADPDGGKKKKKKDDEDGEEELAPTVDTAPAAA